MTYARKGSQRWLQIAVDRAPHLLTVPLVSALGLVAGEDVDWRSPRRSEKFIEYRDQAAFDLMGSRLEQRPLRDFWPAGGPVWDALGRSTISGQQILVEAKAHIAEMISPASKASEPSLKRIRAALTAVRDELSPKSDQDWSGVFYQYTNRLAYLHFLRIQNKQPAHLVFVYFVNAHDVTGPTTRVEWDGAIKLVESYLGVTRHRLSQYVHKVFIDVDDLRPFVEDEG